jgi:hypothetical protein
MRAIVGGQSAAARKKDQEFFKLKIYADIQ